jgi:hypothetical protein
VNVGHGKEIYGHHLMQMVVKEGLPGLSGRVPKPAQNARDSALGDGDAEHFQFAMNPGRTPQRICGGHSFD